MKPLALLIAIALTCPAIAHADVIVEHPLITANAQVRTSAWLFPDGLDTDYWCWDAFTVATPQTVTDIEWYGTYLPDIQGFDVSICPAISAGIQPDVTAPPYAKWTTVGDTQPVSIGTFNGVPLWRYAFHLPQGFALTAGTVYWLQIEATETQYNAWGWATGSGGNNSHFVKGPAFYAGDVSYFYGGGDLAFRLLGATLGAPSPGAEASFALEGATPNPARGSRVTIAYALPDATPASLELFDVNGRRLASVDAARGAAGRHVLDLATGRALEPGLYFARLTQGGRALQSRVVVTR